MHVYITVIVEYFLTFLALKKIKPPLVRTTAVWISHCWEMVYKKFKCITSQSCNLFPLLRTSTGRSTQRREHPKEGAPTRGNSFQMRKTWIHILNYYPNIYVAFFLKAGNQKLSFRRIGLSQKKIVYLFVYSVFYKRYIYFW